MFLLFHSPHKYVLSLTFCPHLTRHHKIPRRKSSNTNYRVENYTSRKYISLSAPSMSIYVQYLYFFFMEFLISISILYTFLALNFKNDNTAVVHFLMLRIDFSSSKNFGLFFSDLKESFHIDFL